MKWTHCKIQNITEDQANDTEKIALHTEKYEKFKIIRGEVVEAAIDIEGMLTAIICHFLVGRDYYRHELLRALIFDKESCTFMQKRKMLSVIFEMFPDSFDFLDKTESKKLRRKINDLILQRDMFAHGEISTDAENDDVLIEFYRNGKVQTKIDEQYTDDIFESCRWIQDQLYKLNEFLRENRMEK